MADRSRRLTDKDVQWVRTHRRSLTAVLEADEPFRYRDVDIEFSLFQGAFRKNIITSVGKDGKVHEWVLSDAAKDILEESEGSDRTLPCGCSFHINHTRDGIIRCERCGDEWPAESLTLSPASGSEEESTAVVVQSPDVGGNTHV